MNNTTTNINGQNRPTEATASENPLSPPSSSPAEPEAPMAERFRELHQRIEELETHLKEQDQHHRHEVESIRKQEQQVMRMAKVAAMGQMVSSIAHHWRQPLTSLSFILQNIKTAYQLGKLNHQYMETSVKDALAQVNYLSQTIDDLMYFQKSAQEKVAFDVLKSVSDVVGIMDGKMRNHAIQVNFQHGDLKTVPAFGFPNEFKQVILNILNNAVTAIQKKIAAGRMGRSGGEVTIQMETVENKCNIRIYNNGNPIPTAVMDRMFEPFYSSHREGRGMGVGLYLSRIIIEDNMGGKIDAVNTRNGVVFIIQLTVEQENKIM